MLLRGAEGGSRREIGLRPRQNALKAPFWIGPLRGCATLLLSARLATSANGRFQAVCSFANSHWARRGYERVRFCSPIRRVSVKSESGSGDPKAPCFGAWHGGC